MYSSYLSDQSLAELMSDEEFLKKFLKFEGTLVRAQSNLGLIPDDAAAEITTCLKLIKINPLDLADDFLRDGIPTVGILKKCRINLSKYAAKYLHLSGTSQDAIDTSHILMYKDSFDHICKQLKEVLHSSIDLVNNNRKNYAVARTRTQQAGPITYAVRFALWLHPLLQLYSESDQLKSSVFNLQFAGAFGTNAILGANGEKVALAMAEDLGLNYVGNWHTNRLCIKKLADWLTSISACLGRIGKDILFLSSNEVGELVEDGFDRGMSSAMPHKSNPILSEAIVALASGNNIDNLKINQALMQGAERDATAWILEWKAMKNLFRNTATCLKHFTHILQTMELNHEKIKLNLKLTNGLIYSPFAKFQIMKVHPEMDAKLLITEAMDIVRSKGQSLAQVLDELTPMNKKWADFLRPENFEGQSTQIVDEFLLKISNLEH